MLPVPKGLRNLLPTLRGAEGLPLRLRSRVGDRLPHRRAAGRRLDDRLVHLLRRREGRLPASARNSAPARSEGVAAPEGANNSETGGALVPLLTLGIPGSRHHGDPARRAGPVGLQARAAVHPGNPTLFWGLVASMYIGNVMLLILNLPLVPLFAQILRAAGLRAVSR